MGAHEVEIEPDEFSRHMFMNSLLDDLHALEYMLATDVIETGICRIGAEQELFLIDREFRAAPIGSEVLAEIGDARLTNEIARFNLEANLSPQQLTGDCFSRMETELKEILGLARDGAKKFNADILLTGILPTLRKADLSLDNLTPLPRYRQLNDAVTRLRRGPFSIHIKGLDEIQLSHDNIMMESCNTSFQIHIQVDPRDFAASYNIAQAITAPVLAAAVNSPLLFGRRLWQETRLALFQHSIDSRSVTQQARSEPTRVGFGDHWLHETVLELFYEQIARFRPIMTTRVEDSSMAVLARGEIPRLPALQLHNGTVWPWNRACYGITNGRPHLRIENRVLPSGPSTLDEIANAAFFVGLVKALPREYGDIRQRLKFDDVKENFLFASRSGLSAQFTWLDGSSIPAPELILNHLLPLARQGLQQNSVATSDVDRYLDVIEERVRTNQTGAQWILRSFGATDNPREARCRLLAQAILTNQSTDEPVHCWPIERRSFETEFGKRYQTVGQFMTTDLFTMRPDDLVDLAASVMDWRHIRHVPVEDDDGRLVGLISHRALLRLLTRARGQNETRAVCVREIMRADPFTVTSTTPSLEAMELMRSNRVGCLPVVDDGQLVGIVTSYDFLEASAELFQKHLSGTDKSTAAVFKMAASKE